MKKDPSGDDSRLVEACINRDLIAWSQLINRYSGLISVSIVNRLKKYGLTVPSQDVEDIRQNVLISIWQDRKLESIQNRAHIGYWLSIVSGNIAIEYMRKKRNADPPGAISIYNKLNGKELSEFIPQAGESPKDEIIGNELLKKIDEAIEALPNKEKLIAKLNILYGKKYHEITDILNVPYGTVSSYMKRAKDKLRAALKDFA